MLYIMCICMCIHTYVCMYTEVTLYWLKQVILTHLRIYLTTTKEKEATDLRAGKKDFIGRPRGKGREVK